MTKFKDIQVVFLHQYLEGGGAERISLTTAKFFSDWGIQSYFISQQCNKDEFIPPKEIKGTIIELPERSSLYSRANIETLRSFIKEKQIQILFFCALDNTSIYSEFRDLPCKIIIWPHSVPFWEYKSEVEHGELRAKYSLKYWVKWNLLGGKFRTKTIKKFEELKERYQRDVKNFDKYIVLCDEDKKLLSESLALTKEDTAKIIPFVNTLEINPEPKLEKKKEIVFVSRLCLVAKRFDNMLDIWKLVQNRLPDWTLKVYGTGPDSEIFHRIVKRYRLKNLEYCGYETDLSKIYDTPAIICMTSSFEGWGMVLAEGQNNGVVPIAFDCSGGVKTIIGQDERAGRLVKPFDLEAYADKLVELCQNETLRKELQKKCLLKREDYNPHVNDETWAKLLDELLEDK